MISLLLVPLILGASGLTNNVSVPVITLNNGVKMPAVAAGTWQYTTDYAEKSVAAALQVGFTHIDTAHDYCADGSTDDCSQKGGSNQAGIAKALAGKPRDSIFLTTKVPGCGLQGIGSSTCAADSVAAADKNLHELGLDFVDLLLVHFPPEGGCSAENCKLIKAQWRALSKAHLAKNKTRALGVSNFCISCLQCLAEDASSPVPAVNQFKYHIGMGKDPEGLVSFCKARGIVAQAYSPLGDNTDELINGELVSTVGAAHGKSGVQVSLRWIYQNGVAVTTKSGSAAHLSQDLDLFDWSLTEAEMAQANAATKPAGQPSFMCSSSSSIVV
jgi:diketogulonate reductase-like aldo/keto reductase